MNIETLLAAIITAVITAALVAGANHFWNRRYLLLIEREKYRLALFSEKLKADREICDAIREFNIRVAEASFYFSLGVDRVNDFFKNFLAAIEATRDVQVTINRHIFLFPSATVDRISRSMKFGEPVDEIKDREAANVILVEAYMGALRLLDILRDDLGIEDFGQKIKKGFFH